MSPTTMPTRLRWDGRHGVARHDGVEVQLAARPVGMHYVELDYAPGVVAQCRDRACDPIRDLAAGVNPNSCW